jgi:hypothetical protein
MNLLPKVTPVSVPLWNRFYNRLHDRAALGAYAAAALDGYLHRYFSRSDFYNASIDQDLERLHAVVEWGARKSRDRFIERAFAVAELYDVINVGFGGEAVAFDVALRAMIDAVLYKAFVLGLDLPPKGESEPNPLYHITFLIETDRQ